MSQIAVMLSIKVAADTPEAAVGQFIEAINSNGIRSYSFTVDSNGSQVEVSGRDSRAYYSPPALPAAPTGNTFTPPAEPTHSSPPTASPTTPVSQKAKSTRTPTQQTPPPMKPVRDLDVSDDTPLAAHDDADEEVVVGLESTEDLYDFFSDD